MVRGRHRIPAIYRELRRPGAWRRRRHDRHVGRVPGRDRQPLARPVAASGRQITRIGWQPLTLMAASFGRIRKSG